MNPRYFAPLLALCLSAMSQAAPLPADGTSLDLRRLPERDVAVICGYSLSEGAVALSRTHRLSADEQGEALRQRDDSRLRGEDTALAYPYRLNCRTLNAKLAPGEPVRV